MRFVAERSEGPAIRDFWLVHGATAFGVTQVAYTPTHASAWVDEGLVVEEDVPHAPAWAPWPPEPRPALGERIVHAAVGWPFRCATAKRLEDAPDEASVVLQHPLLPYRPLPIGLLLNTLTASTIVLLLICAGASSRRVLTIVIPLLAGAVANVAGI